MASIQSQNIPAHANQGIIMRSKITLNDTQKALITHAIAEGWTQRKLCERIGVSESWLRLHEKETSATLVKQSKAYVKRKAHLRFNPSANYGD